MAQRFMHTVLTPAVLEAKRHFYGRQYASTEKGLEPEALRQQEIGQVILQLKALIAELESQLNPSS